ncbi:la related protein 7 [Nomia melanderi]|uniref:la related protein 7 n=1 Tax=Nomia melanderi TaxID=2448451 RepID=UPI0013042635|nr:la-related protein 7 [Nomia melanderi]
MVMEEQQTDMELDSERVPVPQVQKPVEDPHVDSVNNVASAPRGKPRLRKKALHAAILKQMEFYFSNANLTKDRFLSNLIKKDPYVDLTVFTTFNKIRELTTNTSRICKALESSKILATSEDGTKVRRITPIVSKKNTDDCTLYVQNLPPDADHEMLNAIFSQYGSVVYVSIPRYKQTKKIKGFAFVEFDTPNSVKTCLKAFQKKGCVLPSHTSPDELLSITTFDDTEKDVTLEGKKKSSDNKMEESENVETEINESLESNEEDTTLNHTSEHPENKDENEIQKSKHQDGELSDSVETEHETHNESIKNNISVDSPKKSLKRKRSEGQMLDNGNESEQMVTENSTLVADEQEDTSEKKKKRKRKRRSKVEDISVTMGLQVMTKKEWKHLRNKYLELQRSKMKQLKQHLRKTRWNQWSNYEKNKPEKEETNEKEKTNKQDNASACRFSFIPGVIVKIEMEKPCTDPKLLKMELKGSNSVKYIDITEGSFLAFVRCDTPEGARALAQKSDEERHMTILEGEEEQVYWDKILHDREEKLGKKIRPKQRGRNKLLKKAEKELGKHIKFDEV